MITFLKVRNLAIVEELAIEPGPGLNVLTGETGAGKSLLIDSLEFLGGSRGSADLVRNGEDRMSAEAVLSVPASLLALLEERGIECEQHEGSVEVVLRREMSSTGRGRVSVNGTTLTLRELLPLTERFIEIHGQDESRGRVAGQSFLEMLDAFAGNRSRTLNCRNAYQKSRLLRDEHTRLLEANRDRSLRMDLLRYQIEEITAIAPKPGEEEELRTERSLLANAHDLVAAAAAAFALLDDDELSVTVQLSRASQQLTTLARSVEEIRGLHDELDELRTRAREAARSLSRIADTVRHDPDRLEAIEDRLAKLERIRKKYGGTIEAALEHLATVQGEFDQLNDFDARSAALENDLQVAFEDYQRLAVELSNARISSARALQDEIKAELLELAMERTAVKIVVASAEDASSPLQIDGRSIAFGPEGYDQVEILIAPNLGDDPRPMQKIASGGELSRIQLAVITALFKHSDRASSATLVFDEIDAGVGGRIAEAVGRKLARLSVQNQVICVTHLPQIAARATSHFHVWKEDVQGRTRARIEPLLKESDRVEEIARMLAGAHVTDSARTHAAELLTQARADQAPTSSRRTNTRARVSP